MVILEKVNPINPIAMMNGRYEKGAKFLGNAPTLHFRVYNRHIADLMCELNMVGVISREKFRDCLLIKRSASINGINYSFWQAWRHMPRQLNKQADLYLIQTAGLTNGEP